MCEQLERLNREQEERSELAERIRAFARSIAHRYDRRPVSKAEWDAASGDTPAELGLPDVRG